jgi:hypothetical protein
VRVAAASCSLISKRAKWAMRLISVILSAMTNFRFCL